MKPRVDIALKLSDLIVSVHELVVLDDAIRQAFENLPADVSVARLASSKVLQTNSIDGCRKRCCKEIAAGEPWRYHGKVRAAQARDAWQAAIRRTPTADNVL